MTLEKHHNLSSKITLGIKVRILHNYLLIEDFLWVRKSDMLT